MFGLRCDITEAARRGVDLTALLAAHPLGCWDDTRGVLHLSRGCAQQAGPRVTRQHVDVAATAPGDWCKRCCDYTPDPLQSWVDWSLELAALRDALHGTDRDVLVTARWAHARASQAAAACVSLPVLAEFAAELRTAAEHAAEAASSTERDAALRWCATVDVEHLDEAWVSLENALRAQRLWAAAHTEGRGGDAELAGQVADAFGAAPATVDVLRDVDLAGLDLGEHATLGDALDAAWATRRDELALRTLRDWDFHARDAAAAGSQPTVAILRRWALDGPNPLSEDSAYTRNLHRLLAPWPQRHHPDEGTLAVLAPQLVAETVAEMQPGVECAPVSVHWDDGCVHALLDCALGLLADGTPSQRAVASAQTLCAPAPTRP